jgi:hypothetical protein
MSTDKDGMGHTGVDQSGAKSATPGPAMLGPS